MSGWTPSPACLFFLPQVHEPPLGRKNLTINIISFWNRRLHNSHLFLKTVLGVKKVDLSSPSACLFLRPQPVWGADTACARRIIFGTNNNNNDNNDYDNDNNCAWQIMFGTGRETTWFRVGPSTAAPRAPRPSPMMPPSIALFPVENIWGIFCSSLMTIVFSGNLCIRRVGIAAGQLDVLGLAKGRRGKSYNKDKRGHGHYWNLKTIKLYLSCCQWLETVVWGIAVTAGISFIFYYLIFLSSLIEIISDVEADTPDREARHHPHMGGSHREYSQGWPLSIKSAQVPTQPHLILHQLKMVWGAPRV